MTDARDRELDGSPGLTRDTTDWAAASRRAVAHMIKMRARHYARRPLALEALWSGLSCASPETLIAIATRLVEQERRSPRRWFGFGGEVSLVNARAALLLGRHLRRAQAAPAGDERKRGKFALPNAT